MIADFLSRLLAPEPAPMPDLDARLALTALLVRIAKSDGEYSVEEIARIDRITAERYGLSVVDAAKLRADAEAIEHEAPDTVRFTRAIKEAVPYEDRLGVIEALWQVVLADGVRDSDEDSLLRMIAPMLGVTDQESALARQRVEADKS
ncbi:TerB family tellurite resistance protein [Flavimaricola marinus]|nr:TerB family tellurite resistance protein [Flavimaricola marinus]